MCDWVPKLGWHVCAAFTIEIDRVCWWFFVVCYCFVVNARYFPPYSTIRVDGRFFTANVCITHALKSENCWLFFGNSEQWELIYSLGQSYCYTTNWMEWRDWRSPTQLFNNKSNNNNNIKCSEDYTFKNQSTYLRVYVENDEKQIPYVGMRWKKFDRRYNNSNKQ